MPDNPYQESEAETEIIRQGEEALGRHMRGFERWLTIGHAFQTGRAIAQRVSGARPGGQSYKLAYEHWLDDHPRFKSISQSTISWIDKCLEHGYEILYWREQQGEAERVRYQYPEIVYKRWERAMQAQAAADGMPMPEPPAREPTGLRLRVNELERDLANERVRNEALRGILEDRGLGEQVAGEVERLHEENAALRAENADLMDMGAAGDRRPSLQFDLSTSERAAESAEEFWQIYGEAYSWRGVDWFVVTLTDKPLELDEQSTVVRPRFRRGN